MGTLQTVSKLSPICYDGFMKILGIETSCDETALSIVEVSESDNSQPTLKILSNAVLSQIEIHKQYGGVFPALAKREHAKNLIPLLKQVLMESGFFESRITNQESGIEDKLIKILEREPELLKQFLEFIPTVPKPPIDLIAVTNGPGLEPALWVGVNFAKALAATWNIPVVPSNHMEGHILVSLLDKRPSSVNLYEVTEPKFPALALLLSGGHTEMVLMKDSLSYEIVGQTQDDAVGEAFDKVARIMGLSYPGGPEISKLAEAARSLKNNENEFNLPRPMLNTKDLNFSFSGLKTAVLYLVKKLSSPLPDDTKMNLAREFEDAVTEVIIKKVKKAIETFGVQTLILGGGVVANKNIRTAVSELSRQENIDLKLPEINNATDNALMIAIAGYFGRSRAIRDETELLAIKADGNLRLS